MKKLLTFFKNLFTRKSKLILLEANEKLEHSLKKRQVERALLKSKIKKSVFKLTKVGVQSVFIPKHRYNNIEIKNYVEAKFGVEMNKLGISISNDLILCEK